LCVGDRYVIGLHSSYYTDRLITHPLSTATHFIKTNFFFHLMCILPFEMFVFVFSLDMSCNYHYNHRNFFLFQTARPII